MKKRSIFCVFLTVLLMLSLIAFSGCGKTVKQGSNETKQESNEAKQESSQKAADSAETTQEKKVVLKLGTIHSAEDLATDSLDKMAEMVKEKTAGSVVIEHYPASQLGDVTSQIEAVMMGSQDMFFGAASFLTTYVPDGGVAGTFFCFSDEQHFINFLKSPVAKDIEDQFLKEKGVRVISQNWRRSPRVMLTRKTPIQSIDDMKGLKMRVPEIRTYLESVRALGANPTPVPWGETYLALQQGVVDACESPIDMITGMKFHEAAPNITLTNHVRENDALLINDAKWQSLSKTQQEALMSAAEEMSEWYNEGVKKKTEEAVATMKSEGAKFYEVDVAPFVEIMAKAAQSMESDGLWSKGLFDEVQKMK
jgi:tripartite ATP-independent transporter DctP family solute receptor